MSGWLTTAANVFRKRNEEPPQAFDLRCLCGRTVSGRRTRAAQSAICPACGSALFVLPESVYPLPRAPAAKKVVPAKRATRDVPAERSSEAGSGHSSDDAPEIANRTERSAPARSATRAPQARASPPLTEQLPQPIPPAHFGRRRRRLFTPVRLALLGVALVVTATAWWLLHLQALDRARDVLATVPRLADEALAEGDFNAAARQFARLGRALDVIGRDDSQSRRWRQMARETTAAADLASGSLHDILQEAIRTAVGPAPALWSEAFRTSYRDGWVIIDAPVRRGSDPSAGRRYDVDFPLAIGEHQARLVADLLIFEQRNIAAGEPQRVVFAAQLSDCRLETGPAPLWRIELRPETGFLWAGADTYRLLGLPSDDDSLRVLAEQSRLLEIEQ